MVRQGFIYAILVMILWGIGPVFAKAGLAKLSPIAAVTLRNTFIGIIFLVAFIISGHAKEIANIDIRSMRLILIEAILAGLIGQYIYFKAIKTWEVSRIVPIIGAYPLVSFIIGIIFLAEKITFTKVAGAALVVTGVVLLGL